MAQKSGSRPRGAAGNYLQGGPPPHMRESSWLDYEYQVAVGLLPNLSEELERLSDKVTVKSVHDSRVYLRRWFSIWAVLKGDGWDSKKYRRSIDKPLKKLLKLLGELRDWDVNLAMAKEFKCAEHVLELWSDKHSAVLDKVLKGVDRLDIDCAGQDLKKYLKKRHKKLSRLWAKDRKTQGNNQTQSASAYEHLDSAYEHLEPHLAAQEKRVEKLELTASGFEQLHQLRLEIKRWRYLLAEFFGLTNLQLTRAQQVLGKVNDYHRVAILLTEYDDPKALARVEASIVDMLKQAALVRKQLIYGLRPEVASAGSEGAPTQSLKTPGRNGKGSHSAEFAEGNGAKRSQVKGKKAKAPASKPDESKPDEKN